MTIPSRIVLASNNPGKIDEINRMLRDTRIHVVSQSEFGIEEAVEDQPTFVENALIKARHASAAAGLPAIADDSGLVVDAIRGEPGVISSRYSDPGANDERNIAKLLGKLKQMQGDDRNCRFRCLMVYVRHVADASPLIADGTLHGRVHDRAQGDYGFGYDPVVWVPQLECTLAELAPNEKNRISHRGKALRSMVEQLLNEYH
ncbi:MAG: RdgB/HAM1 family non-canonical purine NTP pyrophosphatase [Acidiferrobacterales bacterium]|nr:RdgB/HAM1 family non-canonical purine NTP pyrophosphatase [Acidiferrobacterales bacterium]